MIDGAPTGDTWIMKLERVNANLLSRVFGMPHIASTPADPGPECPPLSVGFTSMGRPQLASGENGQGVAGAATPTLVRRRAGCRLVCVLMATDRACGQTAHTTNTAGAHVLASQQRRAAGLEQCARRGAAPHGASMARRTNHTSQLRGASCPSDIGGSCAAAHTHNTGHN